MEASRGEFQPQIVLLYCRRALAGGEKPRQGHQEGAAGAAKLVMLPCSSKMEAPHLLQILAEGADGLELVACPAGACRMLVGSDRAERRVAHVRRLLESVGLGAERLGITRGGGFTLEKLMELAAARARAVEPLGPNPVKGDGR